MDRQDQDKQDRHEQAAASGMPSYVGIDVSKATLEAAVRPSDEAWQSTNDEVGIAALVSRIQALAAQLIVLEATGGMERLVAAALALAELPVAVVNPRQVRDFSRRRGAWPRPMRWMRRCWPTLPRPCSPRRVRSPTPRAKP